MSDEDFVHSFKLPVLLASFGGLPVPGAEKLLPYSRAFRILFIFLSYLALTIMTIICVDGAFVTANDESLKKIKFFMYGGIYQISSSCCKNLYMIIRKKERAKIINQWETSLKTNLHSDIRKEELAKEKQWVQHFIKLQLVIMIGPVILWGLSPLVTGKHTLESYLPWDHYKSPTFELTLAYHFIHGIFLITTWWANDSFLIINMSLIVAELRYLTNSLKTILILSEKKKDEIYGKTEDLKRLLPIWVKHHNNLMRFVLRLNHFYSPLILIEYFAFVGFSCVALFYAASGALSPAYMLVALSMPCTHGTALYVICWFGERMNIQNQLLSEEIFHNDWYLLPKDIQRNLKFIIMSVQRPIGISAFSIMPLNIKTYEKILKACYTFFMFIRDTSKKGAYE